MKGIAQASTEPAQLHQLTSLRFAAALAVLFSHLENLFGTGTPLGPLVLPVFHEGPAGVSFFYVLSGFILAHSYGWLLANRLIASWKYLLLRLARIYPLHLLTALPLVLLPIILHSAPIKWWVWPNALLLQAWIPQEQAFFSVNSVSWSLSVELFFYASFVFLARMPTPALRRFAFGLLVLVLALSLTLLLFGPAEWRTATRSSGVVLWLTYICPPVRLLDFVAGILIYRTMTQRSAPAGDRTLQELCALALVPACLWLFDVLELPAILRSQLLYLPLMGFAVYAFAPGSGWVSRLLKHRLLVYLGEASFALYMIHQPIINYLSRYTVLFHSLRQRIYFALGLTVLCILASAMVYHFFEAPLHRFLKRRIKALG